MKVDESAVRARLLEAYKKATSEIPNHCSKNCADLIDFVLDNTHLTYKYILVTALAAKATDERVNMLCLQAKSSLPGAYDARSICHHVIVKFEMTTLGKALGGSNEPFLNKPARFTELSKQNAVRKGRDQEILYKLCDYLPLIRTKDEAFHGLIYALSKLIKVKEEREKLTDFVAANQDDNMKKLYSFINVVLNENYEGECLTLIVAGVFELYMSQFDNYSVEVHPVNESGASSKEISDLDVYKNGKLFSANELKDKEFAETDLRRASDRAIAGRMKQINFIVGRHGGCETSLADVVREYFGKGLVINIVEVDTFIRVLLGLTESVDNNKFAHFLLEKALETKFKETTISFVKEAIESDLM